MSIFELITDKSPLVISVPHDGALIPDGIKETMTDVVLCSTDRDYLIGEVFDFEGLRYSKIQAKYSRHVIDLNRPPNGKPLYQNQVETELCPTTTFDFKQIYRKGLEPNQEEVARRIKCYWEPYHDQLRLLVETAKQQFGFCVLVDAHSIDDQVPRFFQGQLPDISVGTFGGKSCAAVIEKLLHDELTQQGDFSFVINGRFKGGFITRHYGDPKSSIHAIQLEHAKGVYLNEDKKLSAKSHVLRQFWSKVMNKISNTHPYL